MGYQKRLDYPLSGRWTKMRYSLKSMRVLAILNDELAVYIHISKMKVKQERTMDRWQRLNFAEPK